MPMSTSYKPYDCFGFPDNFSCKSGICQIIFLIRLRSTPGYIGKAATHRVCTHVSQPVSPRDKLQIYRSNLSKQRNKKCMTLAHRYCETMYLLLLIRKGGHPRYVRMVALSAAGSYSKIIVSFVSFHSVICYTTDISDCHSL